MNVLPKKVFDDKTSWKWALRQIHWRCSWKILLCVNRKTEICVGKNVDTIINGDIHLHGNVQLRFAVLVWALWGFHLCCGTHRPLPCSRGVQRPSSHSCLGTRSEKEVLTRMEVLLWILWAWTITAASMAAALPLKITLLGRVVCFHIRSLLGDSPLKSVMGYFVWTHAWSVSSSGSR